MEQPPGNAGAMWYDDEAGPITRPYTVTGGRTHPGNRAARIDLIDMVVAAPRPDTGRLFGAGAASGRDGGRGDAARSPAARRPGQSDELTDEHLALLARCRMRPASVVDLASSADLPLGVVRVLLGDLLDAGRIRIASSVSTTDVPEIGLLRNLIDGLKAL